MYLKYFVNKKYRVTYISLLERGITHDQSYEITVILESLFKNTININDTIEKQAECILIKHYIDRDYIKSKLTDLIVECLTYDSMAYAIGTDVLFNTWYKRCKKLGISDNKEKTLNYVREKLILFYKGLFNRLYTNIDKILSKTKEHLHYNIEIVSPLSMNFDREEILETISYLHENAGLRDSKHMYRELTSKLSKYDVIGLLGPKWYKVYTNLCSYYNMHDKRYTI